MTPKERSAIQQALDALHNYENTLMFLVPSYENKMRQATLAGGSRAIATLRGALAGVNMSPTEQAEQEPVGRWNWNEAKFEWLTKFDYYKHHMTPLYAAPVRTKDLTDDEICKANKTELPDCQDLVDFARAVIAADREKNK